MPPSILSSQQRQWSRLGVVAAGFGLLVLLVSIGGNDADTADRLLQLRFDTAVVEATKATQQRIARHDRMLGGLALQFNYLGADSAVRFVAALDERRLSQQFPAVRRTGYLMLGADGRLQAHEFTPDAQPVSEASLLGRLSLAALERPLAYSRDFNTLALSAVMTGASSSAPGRFRGDEREVMLVKPVYDNTTVGISRSSRRLHHRGWIYATIDTRQLLAGVENSSLGPLDISVYDGLSRQSEKTLLFGSHRRIETTDARGLQSVRPVGLASRAWTQVIRLDQGDVLPLAAPTGNGWLPLMLMLLAGVSGFLWMKSRWLRQRSQREDTRAF